MSGSVATRSEGVSFLCLKMRYECQKRPISVARAEPGARGQLFGTGGACAKEVKFLGLFLLLRIKHIIYAKRVSVGVRELVAYNKHFWLKGGGDEKSLYAWLDASLRDVSIEVRIVQFRQENA